MNASIFEWMIGPKALAVRPESLMGAWYVTSHKDIDPHLDLSHPHGHLPLGALFKFSLPEHSKMAAFWRPFFGFILILGIYLVIGLSWSFWTPFSVPPFPIDEIYHLARSLFWISICYSCWSLLLGCLLWPYLQRKQGLMYLSWTGIRIDPIVWELGDFRRVVYLILAINLFCVALFLFLHIHFGGFENVLLGTWLYTLTSTIPTHSNATTHLVKQLIGNSNHYRFQDFALISLFFPERSPRFRLIYIVLFSLCASWYILGLGVTILISYFHMHAFNTTAIVFLLSTGLGLWAIWRVLALLIRVLRNHNRSEIKILQPTENDRFHWVKQSCLIEHFPELADLNWQWAWVPQGTRLIGQEEWENKVYWLQNGQALVMNRNSGDQGLELAHLSSMSGFGEMAMLNHSFRSADVIMTRDSLIMSLNEMELRRMGSSGMQEKFANFITLTRVLNQSPIFSSISSSEKNEWLRHGRTMSTKQGEVLIKEGSEDTWMGMVISGRLCVSRRGQSIAILNPSEVFGEMAWLNQSPRTATLTCMEPCEILIWEAAWWSAQIVRFELREYLENLACHRKI